MGERRCNGFSSSHGGRCRHNGRNRVGFYWYCGHHVPKEKDPTSPSFQRAQRIVELAEKVYVRHVKEWHDEYEMSADQSASDAFNLATEFVDYADRWVKEQDDDE